MTIPEKATAAAVQTWFEEIGSQTYMNAMRSALEAAAPHIIAQALREASDAYPLETAYGGAEHAVLWLKERAANLEAVPTGAASVIQENES